MVVSLCSIETSHLVPLFAMAFLNQSGTQNYPRLELLR
jgi:hypothetical protein